MLTAATVEIAALTRELCEVVKAHVRGRGQEALEAAVGAALGWALRLAIGTFGWSPDEAASFVRQLVAQMVAEDERGAS